MSLFPVIVCLVFSFPPIFFELLLSLAIFWLVRRMLVPTVSMILSGIRLCSIPRCIVVCFI
ncbi:electron transfer flavoprotein FixA [Salmonella enterica subsp. enterica]|uniref:Electron transfer flavoprotein FixA n=1 Tax=Salmonella enterica I TaxID=59201 RepID=A0A379WKW0_SALET|nr:electron transfer flavoprotein FixA [Salmonella enterica subsp. enterica]